MSPVPARRAEPGPGMLRDGEISARFARYVAVGIWNTLFGYAAYAALTYLLSRAHPVYGYMIAAVISNALAITVAFLGYKWLVFRTRGNYLHEGWRFLVVYGASSVISLVALPLIVLAIRRLTHAEEAAPYLGAALLVCCNAVVSFIGNGRFTFKRHTRTQGGVEK